MVKRLIPFLVLAGTAIFFLQNHIDRTREEADLRHARRFTAPDPAIVKAASMGYHTLVADIYWLRAIQYYSESVSRGFKPVDLYPLTRFITGLDPDYCMVYFFSGQNMMGRGVDPHKVVEVLEKGKKHCPHKRKLPMLLGYCYYFHLNEREKAAENIELAAKMKELPYLSLLASRIRNEAGQLETGLRFLEEMLKQTEDEDARDRYIRRITEIRTKQLEEHLTGKLDKYHDSNGHYPQSLDELVGAGYIKEIPENPLRRYSKKYRFVYDRKEQRIRSEPRVFLKVYETPKKKKKKRRKGD